MKKTLKDLSREDWNRLFPLELVDHDPNWVNVFLAEKERILAEVNSEYILQIEHFGSTSIKGIRSKPYIDLIIEIPEGLLFNEQLIAEFESLGYTHFKVPAREGIEAYMSFGKGYSLEGRKEQIFHIHMCPGDNYMWRQIAFRDYLNTHPERARQYEDLKLQLVSQYRNDRGAYVSGKSDFIQETLEMIW